MNERIKKLRKSEGLTQQEFADRIGVKQTAIANYESGRNEPIDAVISAICREFGVREEWLRTGEEPMKVVSSREEEIAKFFKDVQMAGDFRERFILALSKLTVNEWKIIEKVAISCLEEQDERETLHRQLDEGIDLEKKVEEKSKASLSGSSNTASR